MENFKVLFNKNRINNNVYIGSIIKCIVIDISNEFIVVDARLKSECYILKNQFLNEYGQLIVKIGDEIDACIKHIDNGFGESILSVEKVRKHYIWNKLEYFYNQQKIVTGIIISNIKGGFAIDIHGIKAFLPGSLMDIRYLRIQDKLAGTEFELKIIKMDKKQNNIIVSRKPFVNLSSGIEKSKFIKTLYEGKELYGLVKNLKNYGAFIDLGAVDGLLHITDISWRRIKHPSEIIKVGQKIKIKVISFDSIKNRVSLGLKQLTTDPWKGIYLNYPKGSKLKGPVTNITDYGFFIEIEKGLEGLVHTSEMDWVKKSIQPTKVVKIGMILEVMVLDVDIKKKRISLGLKQCTKNPWEIFAAQNSVGTYIYGITKFVSNFGIYLYLPNSVEGFVHISDISWDHCYNLKCLKTFKSNSKIKVIILAIDVINERISAGIKQVK